MKFWVLRTVGSVESFHMDASEHRIHRRSPIWLHVVVKPDGEASGREGVVVDLSMGGAAIQLGAWPDQRRGTLGFLDDGERYLTPFTAVGTDATMQGVLLHTRFEALDGRCEAFLAELLTTSVMEFKASQRFLTKRPNDLTG